MYIAARGGEQAIDAARKLLAAARRGDTNVPELSNAQVRGQLSVLVARVMAEASLYDPELAALAIRQAMGDALEASFLLRAYRSTLPRLGYSQALATDTMRASRRITSIFKDLPGGQLLGATFDYTQRLLDFDALRPRELGEAGEADAAQAHEAAQADGAAAAATGAPPEPAGGPTRSPLALLAEAGLIEPAAPTPGDPEPPDITREPPVYPLPRAGRLQMLARADEGWLLGLAYSTQRGYANSHPFAGDLRVGEVRVELIPDELDFAVTLGEIDLTECQMINQYVGSADVPPQFTRGHGLAFGHNERKAMAMALVDRALRHDEFHEDATAPAQSQEFALPHGDGIEASGFVQHLKLPHHVTFEAEMQLLRQLRAEALAVLDEGVAVALTVPDPTREAAR